MEKNGKSNVQWIVHVLLKGKALKSKEIAEAMSEAAEKEIKVQDVASMLSRVSDPTKCDLGFFIKKIQDGKSYLYTFHDEAMDLSEEQLYGLYLKTGGQRYPLEKAVEDYPDLKKLVPNDVIESAQSGERRRRKKKNKRTAAASPKASEVARTSSVAASAKPEMTPPPPAAAVEESRPVHVDRTAEVAESVQEKVSGMLGNVQKGEGPESDLNININISVRFEGFGH